MATLSKRDAEQPPFLWAVDMSGQKIGGYVDAVRSQDQLDDSLTGFGLPRFAGGRVSLKPQLQTELSFCDPVLMSLYRWIPVKAYSEKEEWIDQYMQDQRMLQLERDRIAKVAENRVSLQDLVGKRILQIRVDHECIAFILDDGRNWAFDFDAYVDPDLVEVTRPWIATNGGRVTEVDFKFSVLTVKTDRFPFTTIPMTVYCPNEVYETALYDDRAKELHPERLESMRIISGSGNQVNLHA